jgi:APA family basic amino acid/polyamine antiporter
VDGASLFGKTLETVLADRPCRVIIESPPAPFHERARRRRSQVRRRGIPA